MTEDIFDRLNKQETNDDVSDSIITKDKEQREKTRKRALKIAGSVAAATIIIIGSTMFINNNTHTKTGELGDMNIVDAENNTSDAFSGAGGSTVKDAQSEKTEAQQIFAVDLPEWAQSNAKTKDGDTLPQLRMDILTAYAPRTATGLAEISSENNGYHSEGEVDDYHVTYTKEDAMAHIGEYMERLINPTFGGWTKYQYAENNPKQKFDPLIFKDMFSFEYWRSHEGMWPSEYLPVFADWNNDDYGNPDLSNITRWHGKIKTMETSLQDYNEPTERIEVTATIEYKSYTNDGATETREGVLNMTLVPGAHGERKLVISDAHLAMK